MKERDKKEVSIGSNCQKCFLTGSNLLHDNLLSRYCPNCNGVVMVCERHQRCYSPHGVKCLQPGLKAIKRPYLRKKRVIFVADENFKGTFVNE